MIEEVNCNFALISERRAKRFKIANTACSAGDFWLWTWFYRIEGGGENGGGDKFFVSFKKDLALDE